MENELLQQILTEVKKIDKLSAKVDKLETKVDKIDELSAKVDKLETKVDKIDELSAKVDKLETKVDKIDELSTKVDNLGIELKNFKNEVYELFDKNTKEIATVINELSESISKTMHKNYSELKQQLELNNKEHRIFEAQIAKLQLTTEYLSKGKGKALA